MTPIPPRSILVEGRIANDIRNQLDDLFVGAEVTSGVLAGARADSFQYVWGSEAGLTQGGGGATFAKEEPEYGDY